MNVNALAVKHNLSVKKDKGLIERYELTNYWGTSNSLAERIIRYYDTDINRDEIKFEVFFDL
ncbi:hypothetical protein [Volucribacter amazonae]|uniref:Uncharacterized protein n=1 Tax=Volucribacter amazonae TaxID=256731 RepID=A0A9X4PIZ1_9PAST|nr:hypothetical protein [Volucribacter amazonae]MDG6896215.1 hypothetical protein [Volucribacter amazonae]